MLSSDDAYYARFARAPVVTLPTDAAAMPRVPFAVIVPFRDSSTQHRAAHLARFIAEVGPVVAAAGGEILVLEQSADGRRFNRGRLLNLGVRLAAERGARVVVLHDVDLLPDASVLELYGRLAPHPIHLAAHWLKYAHLPLFFGGVTAFAVEQFERLNGYPNDFWGWGGEDEELYHRLVEAGFAVAVPAAGDYRELDHPLTQDAPELVNHRRFEQLEQRSAHGVGNGLREATAHRLGTIEACAPGVVKVTVDLEPLDSRAGAIGRARPKLRRTTDPPPPRVQMPASERISFHVNVYHDVDLLGDCLESVRQAFPDAAILVRADGDPDPRIAAIARAHGARFFDDLNRYALARGGEYVQVMLERFMEAPTDWLFKIDPDTRIHRPFDALPAGCRVFGTLQRQLPLYSVQGGCIGFTRAAVEHFVERGTFLDPRLARMPPPYLTSSEYLQAHLASGFIAEDWAIGWACIETGVEMVDWPEILSEWRITPDNADLRYAVTHPHKGGPASGDPFVCALRALEGDLSRSGPDRRELQRP